MKIIYRELVLIRKELQAIRKLLEPKMTKLLLDGTVIFDPDNPDLKP